MYHIIKLGRLQPLNYNSLPRISREELARVYGPEMEKLMNQEEMLITPTEVAMRLNISWITVLPMVLGRKAAWH